MTGFSNQKILQCGTTARDIPNEPCIFSSNNYVTYHETFDMYKSEGTRFVPPYFELDDYNYSDCDWHIVTLKTNEDQSAGLGVGVDKMIAYGSYHGGACLLKLELEQYSELVFDVYLQCKTENLSTKAPGPNRFTISVAYGDKRNYREADFDTKLSISGNIPWTRIPPVLLKPGVVVIRFFYEPIVDWEYVKDNPIGRKVVIDNVKITSCRLLYNTRVKSNTPMLPIVNYVSNKILRGSTIYSKPYNLELASKIQLYTPGYELQNIIRDYDHVYYFQDEFHDIYRGIFNNTPSYQQIAQSKYYIMDLSFVTNTRYKGVF